jgi:hypothetical protein
MSKTKLRSRPKPHPTDCGCAFCRNDKKFSAPQHLIEKISAGEVVLFAGVGISTENKDHCQSTFYQEIQAELELTGRLPFPELMSKFCELPDGRIKLLEKIKHRLDYFMAFDGFYSRMTRFHRSIAPLHMITDVITTNWDDFFERECDFDSFVYDGDMAFWDASKRRVMKIHGSITNFGSIIATAEDYQQSYKRLNNGPLGAQLKSLIARKTVIYVGYSLSDENYLRLLRNIARMMEGNIRQSYFVAPTIDKERLKSAPISLIPIETDGSYFFEKIREQLAEPCKITNDTAFLHCSLLLDDVAEAHDKTADKFIKTRHPLLIFALSYQDGLIHALQRILRRRKSGEYHSLQHVHSLLHGYEMKVRDFIRRKDYWNAAYASGYQSGLMFLMLKSEDGDAPRPPLFELPFTSDIKSISGAVKAPHSHLPRDVATQARKILKEIPKEAALVPDHTPYL